MAASALAFEENRIGVNQILAVRTGTDGDSGLPSSREEWLDRVVTPAPDGASALVSDGSSDPGSGGPSA
jgi:cyclopropane-fatty-acyl-phospholipid synthase